MDRRGWPHIMPPAITRPAILFLSIAAACVLVTSGLSCGGVDCKDPKNASSASCAVQTALLECAGSDVSGVITQYTPVVEAIIQHGLNPDGTINYQAIENDLVTAVAKWGWCVVSAAFDHYMHPPAVVAAGSGSGSAALAKATPPSPTPDAARDTFSKLRAKVAPGLKVHTDGGDTL